MMTDEPVRTVVTEDVEDLSEQASALLLSLIREALEKRGRARIILTGGVTPRLTYRLLASRITAAGLDVGRMSWFFGDERWVSRDDPQSNEGMALETLLRPIKAPEGSVHSWHAGSGDAVDCARRYDEIVRAAMGSARAAPDILLLGIGPDGHTASLFPGAVAHLPDGSQVLVAPDIMAGRTPPGRAASTNVPGRAARHGPPLHAAAAAVEGGAARGWRLTLCPDFLRTSRYVVFLVAGAEKSAALARALRGDPGTPAGWIRGKRTAFLVTRDTMGPERADYRGDIQHA
jgi:6-phosphogluconolactonase/glucosamine-6-phosphate isomerase/deaminase